MADHTLSIDELRGMPMSDLLRERSAGRMAVAKMRIGIELKKEKDTAAYKRAKRGLSRMETVLSEKSKSAKSSKALLKAKKSTTLTRS